MKKIPLYLADGTSSARECEGDMLGMGFEDDNSTGTLFELFFDKLLLDIFISSIFIINMQIQSKHN